MVKQGSSPKLNEIVPKANIWATSSNVANSVDPAVVVLVPKEPDTSFLGMAKEETVMKPSEPSGS